MKKIIKIFFITCVCIFLFVVLGCLGINLYMINFSKPYIYTDISDLPKSQAVIIPGAKVYPTTVSFVVHDRIEGAINVLNNGKVDRILISGDHGQKRYDEVNVMKNFTTQNYNVDKNIIFLDHAGFSTYETMYRARDIFCVKNAIVVTQEFHSARCVYIARKLGLDVVCYVAPENHRYFRSTKINWTVREILARVKNFFLVMFNVKPTYLGEQIPITGDATLSWDQL